MSKMWELKSERGSITVEGSMLLPIILWILFLLLYLIFYMMESGVISGALGSHLITRCAYNQEDRLGSDELSNELDNRIFFLKNITVDMKVGKEESNIAVSGDVQIPLLPLHRFLPDNKLQVIRRGKVQTEHPIAVIRRRQLFEETVD